jgi:hypothetical protein
VRVRQRIGDIARNGHGIGNRSRPPLEVAKRFAFSVWHRRTEAAGDIGIKQRQDVG